MKGSLDETVPVDPLIYRFFEIMQVYGTTMKEIIHEKFSDGIMSAIFGGNDVSRRNFMKIVSSSAAMGIISSIFPLDAAKAWANDASGPLEKKEFDYKTIAEQVFLAADCKNVMKELGYTAPEATYAKHTIMGKTFDPADPGGYLKSFAISRV